MNYLPAVDIIVNVCSIILTSGAVDTFVDWEHIATELLETLHTYESFFVGRVLEQPDIHCVVSWPGIYAKLWDALVAMGRDDQISAAVVFLPERTSRFGMHVDDPERPGHCYCDAIYGR